MSEKKFAGFAQPAVDYLFNLSMNNNKQWFEEHRAEYEQHLLTPFRALVDTLADTMRGIDIQLETRPVVGKTLSRMHRDTRFSKDKTPYKTAMWLAFARKDRSYECLPGFFFELTPFIYRYGMGCYCAPKSYMDNFRALLLQDNKSFLRAIKPFAAGKQPLQLLGEMYKKILNSDVPEKLQPWYQRKELYLMCERPLDDKIYSSEIADMLAADFTAAAPLYHFLLKAGMLR